MLKQSQTNQTTNQSNLALIPSLTQQEALEIRVKVVKIIREEQSINKVAIVIMEKQTKTKTIHLMDIMNQRIREIKEKVSSIFQDNRAIMVIIISLLNIFYLKINTFQVKFKAKIFFSYITRTKLLYSDYWLYSR